MKRAKNFFHGIWSGYVAVGVASLLNLLTVPIALAILGKSAFGLWSAVMQLTTFTNIFDLGLGPSLARLITDYKDHKEPKAYSVFLKSIFFIGLFQALFFSVAALGLIGYIPSLMNIPAEDSQLFQKLVLLQLATVALTFPLRPFGQLLYGHQQIAWINACATVATIVNACVFLLGLHLGWGLYSCVVAAWAAFLTQQAGTIYYVFKLRLLPRLSGATISLKSLKPLTALAGNVFVIVIGLQLISFAPTLLVSRKLGLQALADWTVGTKLVLFVWQLVQRTSNSSEPIFWEMFTRQEVQLLRQRLLDVTMLVAMVSAVLGAGLVAVNAPFVGFWTSQRVHWQTASDVVMAVWATVSIGAVVFNMVPGMTKQLGAMKFVYVFEGALVAGLAYVPAFPLKTAWQVALVLLLGVSIFRLPYGLYRAWRDLRFPAGVLSGVIARVASVALLLLAIALLLRKATSSLTPLMQIAINALVYGLIALPVAYGLGLPLEPRQRIVHTLQRVLPRWPLSRLSTPPAPPDKAARTD
jgi:O-antigen/teichoic acid export membrane protein